ncbi:MAG TPA: ABC transporter ATP-binding protein [Vicinamibacterales bacterium]|nr:ABC transporter ATP-binding protein [Vicinamibacterales bacterium]
MALSMSASPLLLVSGLTKSFGSLTAIEDVSFRVERGEILGLIGPNGAGKTTLFECLAGVLPPTRGQLMTAPDRPLGDRDRTALIFFVPDGIRPYADQPVRWVLDFALGFFGGDPANLQRVTELLKLTPLLGQRLGALSKGQAKRTMLAFGLLTPQPILMIDEPFEGLDLRQTRDAAAALREFADDGRTLFLSIHQIADAARVCDRLVLLSGSRVRGEGTAAELMGGCHETSLESAFLALT